MDLSNRRRGVDAARAAQCGGPPSTRAAPDAPRSPADAPPGNEAGASDCVYLKVRQLARGLACHYDAQLGQAELRTTQFGLLSAIRRLQPVQPSLLALHMGLDPSTLSRNLRPLNDAGWVQSCHADGRKKLLTLTPYGLRKEREGFLRWRRARQSVHALLGDDRVARLRSLVDEYLHLLDSPVDAVPPGKSQD